MATYELVGLNEGTPQLVAPTASDTGSLVGNFSVAGTSAFTTGAFTSTLTSGTHTVSSDLALATGSITSASGAITFGNENLVTTGTLGSGALTATTIAGSTGTFSGVVSVDDVTDTTSTITGSIHTDGGIGVAKALWVGTTSRFVGVTTHGGNVVSDTDSTDDLGTTGVRWANLWVDDVTSTTSVKAGTAVIAAGSITDTSGAISFDNENLVTTGTLGAGASTLGATTVTTLGGTGALSGFTTGAFSGDVTLSGTGAMIVPVGTNAQRTVTQGAIRYNTTGSNFEGYNGATWDDLAGGGAGTLAATLALGNTSGAYDVVIVSGQAITTNTISETTAASGVTIDGTLIKDGVVTANLTGNADTVTTNANLTGHVTSVGNAAVLGSFTVAQLSTALSDASISGNNTGDQTSIVGITGTEAQFDTAVTDTNFLFANDIGVSVQAYDADTTKNDVANTFTANQTFDNGIIEEYNATGTSGAVTIDLDTGNNFSTAMAGATTYTFSNPATSGKVSAFTLKVVNDGNAITWPASVDWPAATAPTLSASGATDYFVFITHDGGTTWYGFTAGQAMA